MWIDLNDEESKPMIHTEKDSTGKETDRIIIPAFDLYGKEVGDSNGRERITTLKNLLCKISNEGNTNLRLIQYRIHAVSKAGTMRNIILQHNIFLKTRQSRQS